jgi:hypothetical protein
MAAIGVYYFYLWFNVWRQKFQILYKIICSDRKKHERIREVCPNLARISAIAASRDRLIEHPFHDHDAF